MTLYEYRCRECGSTQLMEARGDHLAPDIHWTRVDVDGHPEGGRSYCRGLMRRVWSVQVAPVMQEHFNTTVQRPVSSMRQFERELRRASDVASEETGIEHRFAPVDPTDRKALGVTDEGLDATNRQRAARGQRPVPLN